MAARDVHTWRPWHRFTRYELHFQRLLRRVEYLENCRRDPIGRVQARIAAWRFKRRSVVLGFTIPRGAFGPGLSLAHYGSVVVNGHARVGRNCRIHSDVNIGVAGGGAPTIGDNVYIGPGAKIFGPITIGDDAVIGANAVVDEDVPAGVTVGGIPAKVISERGSRELLIDGAALAGL
ncbi:MAG: serine O-acetyltransferase [Solirubrobacteraceae bacterium]|jgi:serine O-acetyltransferase|nr:serine O-acetyltransferase [Solirubrobacteraceae bacterium]